MKSAVNSNYILLDSGNNSRLECWDGLIIERPALQAFWQPALSEEIWNSSAAVFGGGKNKAAGWQVKQLLPSPWLCNFSNLKFQLEFKENGQLGLFPEQFSNWLWLQNICRRPVCLKILNAFAHTGGATIAAASTNNVSITHLDSAGSAVRQAKKNAELSCCKDVPIRWITDDAFGFMEREIRRKNSYNGIILDPPAFGKGKGGKTFKLQRDLPQLIAAAAELLQEKPLFLLLSWHAPDLKQNEVCRLLAKHEVFKKGEIEGKKLVIKAEKEGNDLPAGNCLRWTCENSISVFR